MSTACLPWRSAATRGARAGSIRLGSRHRAGLQHHGVGHVARAARPCGRAAIVCPQYAPLRHAWRKAKASDVRDRDGQRRRGEQATAVQPEHAPARDAVSDEEGVPRAPVPGAPSSTHAWATLPARRFAGSLLRLRSSSVRVVGDERVAGGRRNGGVRGRVARRRRRLRLPWHRSLQDYQVCPQDRIAGKSLVVYGRSLWAGPSGSALAGPCRGRLRRRRRRTHL